MIQRLWVYPLKSGAAVPVDTITLGALGLTGDREYLLTDTDGRFLSARADPVIGQIGFDGVALDDGRLREAAAVVAWSSPVAAAPLLGSAGANLLMPLSWFRAYAFIFSSRVISTGSALWNTIGTMPSFVGSG